MDKWNPYLRPDQQWSDYTDNLSISQHHVGSKRTITWKGSLDYLHKEDCDPFSYSIELVGEGWLEKEAAERVLRAITFARDTLDRQEEAIKERFNLKKKSKAKRK